jgi:hypothetical protein
MTNHEISILSVKKGADSKVVWLLLLIALPGFFVMLGVISDGGIRITHFCIALLGVFLAWKARHVFLDSNKLLATFSAQGISLSEGMVFQWNLVKEAVTFKYAGEKWVGFALHESALPLLSEEQKKWTESSIYGKELNMPVAFPYDELAERPESWLPKVRAEFRIPFRQSDDPDPLMAGPSQTGSRDTKGKKRTKPGQKVIGVLGSLVLWPVSLLMVLGAVMNNQLMHKGLVGSASIIEKPLLAKGRSGDYFYHLHYRYRTSPAQPTCDGTDTVTEAMGRLLAVGSSIQIRYVPGTSCYSQMVGSTENRGGFGSALLFIVFAFVWTSIIFQFFQKPQS